MAEEKKYQKLTQIEHILKRPDTYVGSIDLCEEKKWIWNNDKKKLEYKRKLENKEYDKISDFSQSEFYEKGSARCGWPMPNTGRGGAPKFFLFWLRIAY